MATNLAIDDKLLNTALTIGGLKTKKETVTVALDEFIKRRKRQEAIALKGKVDFDEDWSPRKIRGKK
ncbi:type II toxin-antitoxin system VapB family antitoxin [Treponema sp. OttesenSCG-928-L16]|nr:type II toxin-antitoxin system VapB family antitoxin [Treponema sp. OttesenSCG-928-L16]